MALGSSKLCVLVILLLTSLSHAKSTDTNSKLLQGLNGFRAANNLPALIENDNAKCVADRIADQVEDQPCNLTMSAVAPRTLQQFSNYRDMLDHCKLPMATVQDGVALTTCVRKRNDTLVVESFSQPPSARSLRNGKYVGVGIGYEDDWVVVVLTTNTSVGNFASGVGEIPVSYSGWWALFGLVVSFFVVLM